MSYFFKAFVYQDVECKGKDERQIYIVSWSKTYNNLKSLKTHEYGNITKPFY